MQNCRYLTTYTYHNFWCVVNKTFVVLCFFFLGQRGNHQNDESRSRCAKRVPKTMSDFYWLKTPPAPQLPLEPGPRYLVGTVPAALAYNWPDIGPARVADSSLAFFREVGSSSEVTPSLVAGTFDEQMRSGTETRRSAHGVKPRVPPVKSISPWTCQAWVALSYIPKDHRITQTLPRRQRGNPVGRGYFVSREI